MENQRTKSEYVNVKDYGFICEPRYYFFGWSKSPKILARISVVKALVKAKKLLPKGYNFKIWDCFRSYRVQELMIKSFQKRINLKYQSLANKDRKRILFTLCSKLVRKVERLDTHRNGGSFDLTIIDQSGTELFMGTDHDDITECARLDYYEKKKNLTVLDNIAKKNRRILIKVMPKSGFIKYDPEWWHWSYDK